MSLDLKQTFRLSQQILMTPQLQQAIKILQLSRLEIEQFVQQQLTENPVLEEEKGELDATFQEETGEHILSEEVERERLVDSISSQDKELDWEALVQYKDSSPRKSSSIEDDAYNYENMVSRKKTLGEHLLSQVGEIDFSKAEKDIAEKLVGNISENGILDLDLESFCVSEQVDPELVEGVLDSIQRFDPIGVGARSLQECLLIQLREYRLKNGVVEKIVQNHLKDIENFNYDIVAKSLKIREEEVLQNVDIILRLNPHPGDLFNQDPVDLVVPDVFIFKKKENWQVTLNEDNLPDLKLSSYYREIAKDIRSGKEKDYIQEKIKSAQWLIKSMQQRKKTILKVTESIVQRQIDFLEKGPQYLKPMILKDVAADLGLHESTVSRATNGKYAHTPRGIRELKFFFSGSLTNAEGEELASESVKVTLKQVLDQENPKKPYSDQELVALLREKGISLARRTVAKYRDQLGILSSSKRKRRRSG
ncbi:MAG: RNA polymerase factor sigma-54 [Oligoflexales bacterium]|nr:RNA polymerase factor sigma-54 [Oligoflexales bacterium]